MQGSSEPQILTLSTTQLLLYIKQDYAYEGKNTMNFKKK